MSNHWDRLKDGQKLLTSDDKVYGFENKLIWDKFHKRLILTVDAINKELKDDLASIRGDEENAREFLNQISLITYEHILRKKPAILREKMQYYLKYSYTTRKVLYDAMVDMVRYTLYGGGNIIGYQPAINFNETSIGDIEKVRDERVVSYVTDSILKTNFLTDRNFVEDFTLPNEEW